jgi:hypothetical protein
MRTFLDVGALSWAILLLVSAALWILHLPEIPGTFGTVFHHYNPLAIPFAFFFFYVFWHMLRARRSGWIFVSLFLAPLTFLIYYWRIVRAQLTEKSAQQAVQPGRREDAAPG